MSWKDVVKIFTPVREDERCGYCGELIGDNVHNRNSSRFKDVENPICSKCNLEVEMPRRFGAKVRKGEGKT